MRKQFNIVTNTLLLAGLLISGVIADPTGSIGFTFPGGLRYSNDWIYLTPKYTYADSGAGFSYALLISPEAGESSLTASGGYYGQPISASTSGTSPAAQYIDGTYSLTTSNGSVNQGLVKGGNSVSLVGHRAIAIVVRGTGLTIDGSGTAMVFTTSEGHIPNDQVFTSDGGTWPPQTNGGQMILSG